MVGTSASVLIDEMREVQRLFFYEWDSIMETELADIQTLLTTAVAGPDGLHPRA